MSFRRNLALFSTTALASALCTVSAHAMPSGGNVVAGGATITTAPVNKVVTVRQTTDKAIINWQNFDAAAGETTRFVQPSANATILNRVVAGNGTIYHGNLTSNGKVFLVDPRGIFFGAQSRVNVGGLIASTAGISNANFMSGRYVFDQPGITSAAVVNRGVINVQNAGPAALLGAGVRNDGTINAYGGSILLGATRTATIDFAGDGLINFAVGQRAGLRAVDPAGNVLPASVVNSGTLSASTGEVTLSSNTVRGILDNAITTTATSKIDADTRLNNTGKIVIESKGGRVNLAGSISAKRERNADNGGSVSILGGIVNLLAGNSISVEGETPGTVDIRASTPESVNKQHVVFNSDATSVINADATPLGGKDGGTVNIEANGALLHSGTISARGSYSGGNGGSVTISSTDADRPVTFGPNGPFDMDIYHSTLGYDGKTDVGATNGRAGTLTLRGSEQTPLYVLNENYDPRFETLDNVHNYYDIKSAAISADLQKGNNVRLEGPVISSHKTISWSGNGNLTLDGGYVGIESSAFDFAPSNGYAVAATGNGALKVNASAGLNVLGRVETNNGNIDINASTVRITPDYNTQGPVPAENMAGIYSHNGNITIDAASGIYSEKTYYEANKGVINAGTGKVTTTIGSAQLGNPAFSFNPQSLQATLDAMGNGNAKGTDILLRGGTYTGNFTAEHSNTTLKSLSAADPARIQGDIRVTGNNFTIDGLDVAAGDRIGISYIDTQGGAVKNTAVHDSALGIFAARAKDLTVSGNRLENISGTAVAAHDTNYNIQANIIRNAATGVHSIHSAGNIAGNVFNGINGTAVTVVDSAPTTGAFGMVDVWGNVVDNAKVGFADLGTSGNKYRANTVRNTTGDAFYTEHSRDAQITGNQVSNAGGVGVVGYDSANLNVSGNMVDNAARGVLVSGGSAAAIDRNIIRNTASNGITVIGMNGASVIGNRLTDVRSGTGIAVRQTQGAVITDNVLESVGGTAGVDGAGISVDAAPAAPIRRNRVSFTRGNGIEVIGSNGSFVTGNTLTQIGQQPIVLSNSSGVTVEGNN